MIKITIQDEDTGEKRIARFNVLSKHSFGEVFRFIVRALSGTYIPGDYHIPFARPETDHVMRDCQANYIGECMTRGLTDHDAPEAKEIRLKLWREYQMRKDEGVEGSGAYNDRRNFYRKLTAIKLPEVALWLQPIPIKDWWG